MSGNKGPGYDFYTRFVEACHGEQGLADIRNLVGNHYSGTAVPAAGKLALVADALIEFCRYDVTMSTQTVCIDCCPGRI